MLRNLKALALAVVVLTAVGGGTAATAQAFPLFHSELTETTVTSTADGTGKQAHHVMQIAGGELTCSGASFHGLQTAKTVSELTLSPTYTGCNYLGVLTTVVMGGCNFVLSANGEFAIASKAGKNCGTEPITWEVGTLELNCKIEIFPQSGRKGLTFKNIKPGTVEEITMEMKITKIAYNAIGNGCVKAGEFTDGEYETGNTILTGAKPGGGAMTNYKWE